MPSGARAVVATLESAGVQVCFGLPGVHNLPLWEALRTSSVRLVGVRHEQAAVYAADGYSRATGRLGVALVTTGPGAANAAGALGEAWASRSPVLLIATDIPTTLRRPGVVRGALHETPDQGSLFASITAERHRVAAAGDLAGVVAGAVAAPLARRRPVYLEIPTDLLRADVGEPLDAGAPPAARAPARGEVQAVAALLDRAERPLLWAGAGARDAGAEVALLAERLAAPVLTTYGARGILPPSHPCAVGMPPHVEPAGALWDEADVVVAIGSDLDGMNTQNWAQRQPPALAAVNLDAGDATKNYRGDAVLVADAAEGCRALAGAVSPREAQRLEALRGRLQQVRAQACRDLDDPGLRFLDAVGHGLSRDAVVLADMCIPGYWIAGFHAFARPRALQYPVGWGTLGYAFPASLGAALAGAGPVVSFSGDGGFLLACGELATVAQEGLPLTAVIVDDGGYGMLRHDQDTHGVPRHGVDLHTPDFAALAASFGIRAETVDGLDDGFGEALAAHVADPEPSVLVSLGPALRPPPTTSPEWYRRR